MRRRNNDLTAPFQTVDNTARITGLSRDYIRKGIKAGQVPFIRLGDSENAPYLVNVPLFVEQLNTQSMAAGGKVL